MARKKPCEYCEDDNFFHQEGTNGAQLYVEIYPDANYIGITSFANDENGEMIEMTATIPMNYCPNCGRKLEW